MADGALTLNPQPFALNPDHVDVVEGKVPFTPLPKAQTGCWVSFFTVFFLIGLLLAVVTMREWYLYEQLRSTGITTQAYVIQRESDRSLRSTSYFLYLRIYRDGQVYETRASVDSAQYARYQIGDEVTIRYLPQALDIVRVDWDSDAAPEVQQILTGCVVIWNVPLLLFLVLVVRHYWNVLWLSRGGETLIGEITQVRGDNDDYDRYKVTVWYSFQSPYGTTLKGKYAYVRDDLRKNLPRKGTPIVVYYRDERTYMLL